MGGPAASRIREDGHPADTWDRFLEQLQLLAEDVRVDTVCQPRDVAAWPRETRYEPDCDRLGETQSDDRDCSRRIPGGLGRGGGRRHDDVHLEPDELVREGRQTIGLALRVSILNEQSSALDPPELAQSLAKSLKGTGIGRRGRSDGEIPYSVDLTRRLCADGQRRHCEAARDTADEGSSFHQPGIIQSCAKVWAAGPSLDDLVPLAPTPIAGSSSPVPWRSSYRARAI